MAQAVTPFGAPDWLPSDEERLRAADEHLRATEERLAEEARQRAALADELRRLRELRPGEDRP